MSNKEDGPMVQDPLTGVYTRALLKVRVFEEIERSRRYDLTFSVLLMDLDHFKSINDGFGHTRGDEVLAEFSKRVKKQARATDVIFRYGGDEFVILLPNTDLEQAAVLANRVLDAVKDQLFCGDPPLSISMSIGVANYPADGKTFEELFSVADERHYQAKRTGRARVVFGEVLFSEDVSLESPSRLLERDRQIESFRGFLEALDEKKRGVFRINGENKSGRTRFLDEIQDIAQLKQYAVLEVGGKSALRNRRLGALVDGLIRWGELKLEQPESSLPHPAVGVERFYEKLAGLLSLRGKVGIIITLDDVGDVDLATRDFLQELVSIHGNDINIGLVCAENESGVSRGVSANVMLQQQIKLTPLSPSSLRVWLRHSLQWEAPKYFVDWLYKETDGLPGYVFYGLEYLIEYDHLQRTEGGWLFDLETKHDFSLIKKLDEELSPPSNNLPVNLTNFIGREIELQEVKGLVRDEVLVSIVGPGGIGKTRLGVQVAMESLDYYKDGVYFVPLAGLRSHHLLDVTIANAIGLVLSGTTPPKEQLLNYLYNKSMLLVLDNFEHTIGGVDFIAEIISRSLGINWLIVTRTRLSIPKEVIFELEELPYPDDMNEDIESFSAVQLFIQSAKRIDPDFVFTKKDGAHIARICRLVVGIPLGIELAAAWVQTFSCQEIADRIAENQGFLSVESTAFPERHRTLRSVLDSFWVLLSEYEKMVLSELSVFKGGFSVDAAFKVAGASPFFLDALLTKTYLIRQPQGRYQIHEILRQYISEKISKNPERELEAKHRHSQFYLDFLMRKFSDLIGEQQQTILEEINEEIENIRFAWEWAVEHKYSSEIIDSIDCLFYFCYMRSYFKEGSEIFEMVVKNWQELELNTREEKEAFGKALTCLGWFNFLSGSHELAVEQMKHGRELIEKEGTEDELAFNSNYLGAVYFHIGEYEKANELLQISLTICEQGNDYFGKSIGLNILGQIAAMQGNKDKAEDYIYQAIEIKRDMGDRWGMAFSLEYMGQQAMLSGKHKKAEELLQESLVIRQEMRDQRGMGNVLRSLGEAAYSLHDYVRSRKLYMESLSVLKIIGNPMDMLLTLNGLAERATEEGEYNFAQGLLFEALEIGIRHQYHQIVFISLCKLAKLFFAKGDEVKGREILSHVVSHADFSDENMPGIRKLQKDFNIQIEEEQSNNYDQWLADFIEQH